MEVAAHLRNASISAQKTRLVADQIRNLPVERALNLLSFSLKKAAYLYKKLLNSAIANAEMNNGLDIDNLYVSTVYADEAGSLKRMRARAKGRGNRIIKRRCHMTVKVAEREE